MTPLESHKQILLAESALNRALLTEEWQTLADESAALARQAATLGSVVAGVVLLTAGYASGRRHPAPPAAAKTPWWRTLLTVATLVVSLWAEVRSSGRNETRRADANPAGDSSAPPSPPAAARHLKLE